MRVRFPFAIAFVILLILSSSLGLLPHSVLPSAPSTVTPYIPPQSDKFLHFITFFALSIAFYFILDTGRRRVLHLTLFVVTLVLGVGSEVAQGLLPNDRTFDPWDVLANVVGSLSAVGLATAYHRRAADRKRRAKYSVLSGEGLEDGDVELGEGVGASANGALLHNAAGQETGVVSVPQRSVAEELENWDENAEDPWDEEDDIGQANKMTPATSTTGSEEVSGVTKIAAD